jgi:hypothetical protein
MLGFGGIGIERDDAIRGIFPRCCALAASAATQCTGC